MPQHFWRNWFKQVFGSLSRHDRRKVGRIGFEQLESRWVPAAPVLLSLNRVSPDSPTNGNVITYAAAFSESVSGVDGDDFRIATTGSLTTGLPHVTGSGANYTVTVSDIVGNGTVGLNFVDNRSVRSLDGTLMPPGAPAFSPVRVVPLADNSQARAIAAGDLNLDGRVDLVTANYLQGTVSIIYGNGDGTFSPAVRIATQANRRLNAVAVGDVDGDSKADLVVSMDTFRRIHVLKNNGDGTFTLSAAVASVQLQDLNLIDLNGDQKLDIVGFDPAAAGALVIILGNGNGTFRPAVSYAAGGYTVAGALADVNNDGKIDAISGIYTRHPTNGSVTSRSVAVHLGNGDGTFGSPLTFPLPSTAQDISTGDLNSDGFADIVVGMDNSNLGILFGNGNGTFQTVTTLSSSTGYLVVSDLDLDGQEDIAVATVGNTAESLIIYPGNGDGTFKPTQSFASGANAAAMLAVDLNCDGRPDIAVADPDFDGNADIFLGIGSDFNGPVTTVDQSLPTTEITFAPPLATNGTSATFAFSSNDPKIGGVSSGVHHTEYQLDAGSWIAAAGSVTVSGLANGEHTFSVRSVDISENVGLPSTYHWAVDTRIRSQVLSIKPLTPASNITNITSVTYEVAFNGPVMGVGPEDFQVRLSGTLSASAPVVSYPSTNYFWVTISNISGEGTLQLNVVDVDSIYSLSNGFPLGGTGLGNGDFAGETFTIDRTGPIATVSAGPASFTPSNSANFTFAGFDSLSGGIASGIDHFEYRVDGGSYVATTEPISLLGLTRGTHTLQVRAVDRAGNVGSAATYSWTVDQTFPAIQSIAQLQPIPSTTNTSTVIYSVSFTEPVTGIALSNFQPATTGGLSIGTMQLSGSGAQYQVTIPNIVGAGTVGIKFIATPNVRDAAGNPLANSGFPLSLTAPVTLQNNFINPGTAAFVDVNNDGAIDMIGGENSPDGTLQIALGNGNGTFRPPTQISATRSLIEDVEVADFNGDGSLDLVVSSTDPETAALRAFLGNGDGSFRPPQILISDAVTGATVGDFDRDGHPDIAYSATRKYAGILFGNGDGTFRAGQVYYDLDQVGVPHAVAAADFNGDGLLDLVNGQGFSPGPKVLFGNGDGTFQLPILVGPPGGFIRVSDVNNDGMLDLVTTNQTSAGASVTVILGNGNGTFRPPITYSRPNTPGNSIEIVDINCDGIVDIVCGRSSADVYSFAVLEGNGDGTFQPEVSIRVSAPVLPSVQSIRSADFNGDGRADIILYASNVKVLLNNSMGDFAGPITTIDRSQPTFLIASAPSSLSNTSSPTFAVSFDPGQTHHLEYQLDGGPFITAVSPISLPNLADGPHLFSVRGIDNFGQPGPLLSHAWTIDATAPTVSIDSGPPALTNSASATFTFSGADIVSNGFTSGLHHFEYQLDGGAPVVVTSPLALSGLSEGSHQLIVRAVDNAGNSASTQRTWQIDLTRPVATSITRVTPASSPTKETSVAYAVTFSEPVTGVDAADFTRSLTGQLATGAIQVSGSGTSYVVTVPSTLGSGTLRLNLIANGTILDLAGNQLTARLSSVATTIDQAPPQIAFTSGPPPFTASSTATFAFSASDPNTGGVSSGINRREYQLDGGPSTATVNTITLENLTAGPHSLVIRAFDNVGNVATATYTWTTVYTAPLLVGVSPNSGLPSGGNTVTILGTNFVGVTSVRFGANEAGSFAVVSSTQITAKVPAGTGTVDVVVTNVAGTSTVDPASRYSYVRATPTITWTNPANIVYGAALGPTQLNASAAVPGTFVYSAPAGTILHAGQAQPLVVTFNPTNVGDFNWVQKTVFINVLRAPLTIRVNNITVAGSYNGTPIPSATYIGLVNNDTPSAIRNVAFAIGATSLPIAGIRVPPRLPSRFGPGTYLIVASGGLSSDYLITYINGTLKVI